MEINCFIYFAIIKNIKVEKKKKTIALLLVVLLVFFRPKRRACPLENG